MKTTKQDLVRKINELRNELNILNGVQPYNYTSYDIAEEAHRKAVYELENTTKRLENEIVEVKHKIQVNKYWDDNADARKQLDEQKEQLKKLAVQTKQKYIDNFNSVFESLHMQIKSISTSNIEVCLKENDRYAFSIYYHDKFEMVDGKYTTQKELEMNYPCYGSFNVMTDTNHTTYLLAMAAFACNVIMKEQVKRLFDEYETELNNVWGQIEDIEKAINNPF